MLGLRTGPRLRLRLRLRLGLGLGLSTGLRLRLRLGLRLRPRLGLGLRLRLMSWVFFRVERVFFPVGALRGRQPEKKPNLKKNLSQPKKKPSAGFFSGWGGFFLG